MDSKQASEIIVIGKATTADIPQMVAIVNSVYRGEQSKKGWTTEAHFIDGDLRTDEADIAQLMALPSTTFLKAEHPEAGLVGTVFLSKKDSGKLYLGMFSIHLEWQGGGLGRRMLRAAEDLALELGCTSVIMQVIPIRSELMAWYERNGYLPNGDRKPFDGDPRFGVPKVPLEFVILEKQLA